MTPTTTDNRRSHPENCRNPRMVASREWSHPENRRLPRIVASRELSPSPIVASRELSHPENCRIPRIAASRESSHPENCRHHENRRIPRIVASRELPPSPIVSQWSSCRDRLPVVVDGRHEAVGCEDCRTGRSCHLGHHHGRSGRHVGHLGHHLLHHVVGVLDRHGHHGLARLAMNGLR